MNTTDDTSSTHASDDPGEHVDWALLNDLVDGCLTSDESRALDMHLAECDRCRALRDAIRALSSEAASLPMESSPPSDLWGDVASSIGRASSPRRWYAAPRWLAAAALTLMALSSALTVLYLRNTGASGPSVAASPPARDRAAQTRVLPAAFAETERTYLTSVAEVEALVDAQRRTLTPETVAIVDRALATIDAAIAEARAALLADPANRALADLLETSYRQKLDLLRRTAGLSQS